MTKYAAIQLITKNWKALTIVALLIVVAGKFRYDYSQLEEAKEVSEQSLKNQIKGLKEIHEIELADYKEAVTSYKITLAQIEHNYIDSQAELERQMKINRKNRVEQFSGNKAEIIKVIEETYGFIHVP